MPRVLTISRAIYQPRWLFLAARQRAIPFHALDHTAPKTIRNHTPATIPGKSVSIATPPASKLRPHLPAAENNPLVGCQFLQAHWASGVHFLGADCHLSPETELPAIGEA